MRWDGYRNVLLFSSDCCDDIKRLLIKSYDIIFSTGILLYSQLSQLRKPASPVHFIS